MPNLSIRFFICALIFLSICFASPVVGQSSGEYGAPALSQNGLQQQLVESQKANEEAQAEYYRAQTEKLKEKPTPKSVWQNIAENPAAILGALVALIAASITGFTFFVNFRFNIRTQKDTQFYEALKRFGDQESPALRASAAALLGQIGKARIGIFRKKMPYIDTAIDQLLNGLTIEENKVVLNSIRDALLVLLDSYPLSSLYFTKLKNQNLELQNKMLNALADVQSIWTPIYIKNSKDSGKDNLELIEIDKVLIEDHIDLAESITGYEKIILVTLRERYKTAFRSRIIATRNISVQRRAFMGDEAWSEYQNNATNALKAAADRIRVNGEILTGISPKIWNDRIKRREKERPQIFRVFDGLELDHSFLAKQTMSNFEMAINFHSAQLQFVDFYRSNLKNCHFKEAYLEGANFAHADLENAYFARAQLHNVNLSWANLKNVRLAFVNIDSTTNLTGANWWAANFFITGTGWFKPRKSKRINKELLEYLYQRYSRYVPEDLNSAHLSVIEFIKEMRASANPPNQSDDSQAI